MILISRSGETQLVGSLDGYGGWTVVADNVSPPPHEHHVWDKKAGRWAEDTDAKAAAELRAAHEAVGKAELVARLIACEQAIAKLSKSMR